MVWTCSPKLGAVVYPAAMVFTSIPPHSWSGLLLNVEDFAGLTFSGFPLLGA